MSDSGQGWALETRDRVRLISKYSECVFRDVLPAFNSLDAKAARVAGEHLALTGDPDDAEAKGLAFYQTTVSVRQTMMNLFAAGLFHLVEQQLASLCYDAGGTVAQLEKTKLGIVKDWYRNHFSLNFEDLSSWPRVDELRRVANTVKHAEIEDTKELRKSRPELFNNPDYAELEADLAARGAPYEGASRVGAPLAGEDLFVSEQLLQIYVEGVKSFFEEIASHFDSHAQEYYPL